jgi:hypothetical protein
MTATEKPSRLEQALLDPQSVFETPHDVVTAPALKSSEKIEILRRWEYDVREIEVAEEENMQGADGSMLRQVLQALHELGAGPELEHTPPTKQGGV